MASNACSGTATRVAIAATVGNMVSITPAVSATFGVFLVPIAQEFGWMRSTVSGVLLLISVISALTYPVVGRLADRFGARIVVIVGNVALAAAIMLIASTTANVIMFYAVFALVGLAGALPSTVMISKIVSDWFDERRGLMLGVTAGLGNGIGATVMPIIAGLSLAAFGWRPGYAIVGAIVLVLGLPVLLAMLRDAPRSAEGSAPEVAARPEEPGVTLGEAAGMKAFWLVLIAIAASAGAMTALFTHVVPILTDRDVDLAMATSVMSVFALVTAAWQIATGAALDRVRSPLVIIPMYAAAVLGIWMLQHAEGAGALIAAGVLLGIGMGTEFGALPYFISRYFGLRHYGAIAGAIYSVVILAQGIAPLLMDVGFDITASYADALLITGIVVLCGMVLVGFLPPFASAHASEEGDPDVAVAAVVQS